MKKILLTLLFISLISLKAQATTYYVRDGGGTFAQCNGTTNHTLSGASGSNCAWARPMTALGYCTGSETFTDVPPCTVAGHVSAGDTLNINGDSDVTPGAQAQYEVGYDDISGTPGTLTPSCSSSLPSACSIGPIPAGVDSSHKTVVQTTSGSTHQAQLYGTQATTWILNINGGNVDLENIEITEHSSCGKWVNGINPGYNGFPSYCGSQGGSYPRGPWAQHGLWLEGSNIITQNLWIHNLPDDLIYFPANVSNWSSTNDKFIGSGSAIDNGCSNFSGCRDGAANMSFGGNNTLTNDIWAFGGCEEKYPLPDPTNFKNLNNYVNCVDQNGGGLGGGLSMQSSSSACGNWTISNSQFSFNLKSGIDFLHCDGTGTFNFYRSRVEGNTGEALKLNVTTINIESSQLLGNAPVWGTNPFQAILAPFNGNGTSWFPIICRGGAVNLFATNNSEQINILNSDVEGNCGALLEPSDLTAPPGQVGAPCSGMAINSYNTKYIAGYDYFSNRGTNVNLLYSAGNDGNGGGACGTGAIPLNLHKDSVYGEKDTASCTGAGTLCGTDPLVLAENLGSFTSIFGPNNYYNGTSFGDQMYLQNSSPLKAAGSISGESFTNGSSNDYNNVALNSPPDIGGVQYGSLIANGKFCSLSNQCSSRSCGTSGMCTGSCTANAGACTVGSTCCSGFCSGSLCVASICGDGVVTSPEVCDTLGPNLNGQTCVSQGFSLGGTLTCTAGCASFTTSGCSNYSFPTTGVLDTFSRTDTNTPPTGWLANTPGFGYTTTGTIASNFLSETSPYGGMWIKWSANSFGPNSEAYTTVHTLPAANLGICLWVRADTTLGNGYNVCLGGSSTLTMARSTGGHYTQLASFSRSHSAGDSFGISAIGTILTAWYKVGAGSWTAIGAYDVSGDATQYSSAGYLGIEDTNGDSVFQLSNFGGGTYTTGGCTANAGSCTVGSTCCSGLCSAGACVANICGDGIVTSPETCDGQNLNNKTCITQGFPLGGVLSCTNACTFGTSGCITASICGNNKKESGEACDGTDLQNQTCIGLGFSSGSLTCSTDCKSFKTTSCVNSTSGIQGGIIIK